MDDRRGGGGTRRVRDVSAKVSFRVTTYWKRRRGEPGLTQMASRRMDLGEALDWVLAELPAEAVNVESGTGAADRVHIVIDWAMVPAEVRRGTA